MHSLTFHKPTSQELAANTGYRTGKMPVNHRSDIVVDVVVVITISWWLLSKDMRPSSMRMSMSLRVQRRHGLIQSYPQRLPAKFMMIIQPILSLPVSSLPP